MATGYADLVPDADGDLNQWTANTSTRASCVDDELDSHDSDSTYVYATSGSFQTFGFTPITIDDDVDSITDVTLHWVSKEVGGDNKLKDVISVGGTRYYGSTNSHTTTYSEITTQFLTNPKTGTDWTESEATGQAASNEMQYFGWEGKNWDAGESYRVTATRCRINYEYTESSVRYEYSSSGDETPAGAVTRKYKTSTSRAGAETPSGVVVRKGRFVRGHGSIL